MALEAEWSTFQAWVHIGPRSPAWAECPVEASEYLKHIIPHLAPFLKGFLAMFLWNKVPQLSQWIETISFVPLVPWDFTQPILTLFFLTTSFHFSPVLQLACLDYEVVQARAMNEGTSYILFMALENMHPRTSLVVYLYQSSSCVV